MTTKQTKVPAVLSTDVLQPAATLMALDAPATEKPARIVIAEGTRTAFARAAVLLRNGFMFCPDSPPQTFDMIAQAVITLVQGNPDAEAVAGAAASQSQALDQERAAERRAAQASLTA